MSTLEFLLDALDTARERLLVAIEPLEDEALLEKNVAGDWSIADILTNLTAWESELVTGLSKLDQNKRPEQLHCHQKFPSVFGTAPAPCRWR